MRQKMNTSTGAGGSVAVARVRFDNHLNDCRSCEKNLCDTAQSLWRNVLIVAMRASVVAR